MSVHPVVPAPLPPALSWSPSDLGGLERAAQALGRLAGAHGALPDDLAEVWTGHLVRAEAAASARLSGVPMTLRDLLAHEGGATTTLSVRHVREVTRVAAALDRGLDGLRAGVPLGLRLLRDVHEVLMLRRDGGGRMPGLFRSSQIGVGGAAPEDSPFVPPAPGELRACLDALEGFLQDATIPPILKAALAHHQFATIRPFLDGNGRVGRLLVPLVLRSADALPAPVLPLSVHLDARQAECEAALQRVRTDGDWMVWLRFFLEAVEATATRAAETLETARRLAEADGATVDAFGRGAGSARAVRADLLRHPVTTIPAATARLDLTFPTVQAALGRLEAAGVVREVTGGARGRVFAYGGVLDALGAKG